MENTKVTILLIGNSGAGKSTLVNAIFNDSAALTGSFTKGGTTQNLTLYSNDTLNYNIIDTKGLELSKHEQKNTLKQVKEYIKRIIKEGDSEAAIDVIWYCVDASSQRFFKDNVKQILTVYKRFPEVPVIIVLTKSFCSKNAKEENAKAIKNTFDQYDKKNKIRLANIVSVNSAPFITDNNDTIPVSGITELLDKTNAILPEAKKNQRKKYVKG